MKTRFIAKIWKAGNHSLVAVIPRNIRDLLNLKENDYLILTIDEVRKDSKTEENEDGE